MFALSRGVRPDPQPGARTSSASPRSWPARPTRRSPTWPRSSPKPCAPSTRRSRSSARADNATEAADAAIRRSAARARVSRGMAALLEVEDLRERHRAPRALPPLLAHGRDGRRRRRARRLRRHQAELMASHPPRPASARPSARCWRASLRTSPARAAPTDDVAPRLALGGRGDRTPRAGLRGRTVPTSSPNTFPAAELLPSTPTRALLDWSAAGPSRAIAAATLHAHAPSRASSTAAPARGRVTIGEAADLSSARGTKYVIVDGPRRPCASACFRYRQRRRRLRRSVQSAQGPERSRLPRRPTGR